MYRRGGVGVMAGPGKDGKGRGEREEQGNGAGRRQEHHAKRTGHVHVQVRAAISPAAKERSSLASFDIISP